MKLTFTSQEIDKVPSEMVVLMHYQEDVPFRGLLGKLDWRVNGRLSRFVQGGKYSGKAKELLLIPSEHRFKSNEIIVLGLGKKDHFETSHIAEVLDYFLETVEKKKTECVCFSLSQLLPTDFDWRNAVRLLLSKLIDCSAIKEVVLREPENLIREAKRRGLNFGPKVEVLYQ